MSLAACNSSTFTFPPIPGTSLVSLIANHVTTAATVIPQGAYVSHPQTTTAPLSFCNVSVTYSHPGYNDTGVGGGGFSTGALEVYVLSMLGAVNGGYATVSTDGGHNGDPSVGEWAILTPGNHNLPLIEDFATTSVRDTSTIGKAIATSFYGKAPNKAYWNGCSQGGRQGHMLAQRYPDTYDGILGVAPAINWGEFFPNMLWPQAVMNSINYHPSPCEMDAITAAAIRACDNLDGVVDGVISRNDLCTFDSNTLVGREIDCDATGHLIPEGAQNITVYKAKITTEGATVMNLAWQGATSAEGKFEWYGFTRGTPIPGPVLFAGDTTCVLEDGSCESDSLFNCTGLPLELAENWIKNFIYAVPADNSNTTAFSAPVTPWSFNANITSREAFDEIFKLSLITFTGWLETSSTNLDDFRERGGKLLTWHGGIDQLIVPNGTVDYYERVLARDRSLNVQTQDYYRFFEAPGVEHCFGGPGPYPGTAFEALVEWVEQGEGPATLPAESVPDADGQIWKRPLCLYPKKQVWTGQGNPRESAGWTCL